MDKPLIQKEETENTPHHTHFSIVLKPGLKLESAFELDVKENSGTGPFCGGLKSCHLDKSALNLITIEAWIEWLPCERI